MTALRTEIHPLVLPFSGVAGVLLALCMGVGVRLETGYPPGVSPRPFAKLLDKPAPSFELDGLDGTRVSSSAVKGKDWLLFFTNAGCGACDAAYPALKQAAGHLPVIVVPELGNRLVFVSRGNGDLQEYPPEIQQLESRLATLVPVLLDSAGTVFAAYKVQGVPTAFRLDGKGKIKAFQAGAPGSLELVQRLVEETLSSRKRAGL